MTLKLKILASLTMSLPFIAMANESSDPEKNSIPAYKDRVMSEGDILKIKKEEINLEYDTKGILRDIRIDFLAGTNSRDKYFSRNEYGIRFNGNFLTSEYGNFSVDASFTGEKTKTHQNNEFTTNQKERGGGSITVWQRNFYVSENWRMNNGIGVLNTTSTPLANNQYRFYLPSFLILGASNETTYANEKVILNASYGKTGYYEGLRVPSFKTHKGDAFSGGAQIAVNPNWSIAASFMNTDNQLIADNWGLPDIQSGKSNSIHLAAARQTEDNRIQFNLLESEFMGQGANGAWFDAQTFGKRLNHNYGAFYLEDKLSWGALPINSNARGGYYRFNYSYARTNFGLGVDKIDNIEKGGFSGNYYSGFFRQQFSPSINFGGYLNYRDGEHDESYLTQLFIDKKNALGTSRFQIEQLQSNGFEDSKENRFSIDQDWNIKGSSSLTTSLSYLERSLENEKSKGWTTSINGSHSITSNIRIEATIRHVQESGMGAIQSTDANMGVNWQINPRWSLSGSFYQNEGKQRRDWNIDPLAPPDIFWRIPKDRSVFATLRYNMSAGSTRNIIGAPPGTPSGSVSGYLYLDENRDGNYNASEKTVPNAMIILNDSFVVKTDANGKYEFPSISTGIHKIEVSNDSLPLPWTSEKKFEVKIQIRENTTLNLPVTKPL